MRRQRIDFKDIIASGEKLKNRPSISDEYGISKQTIVLDSFEKNPESKPSQGLYRFDFVIHGVTKKYIIGTKEPLENIIRMQTSSFTIPLLPYIPYSASDLLMENQFLNIFSLTDNNAGFIPPTGISNSASQLPCSQKINLYFQELESQSTLSIENKRHHFTYNVEFSDNQQNLLLRPVWEWDVFEFSDPISDIHGLTLIFYDSGIPLQLPPDVIYTTQARSNGLNLLEFFYTDYTNLTNLNTGDRIYFRHFNSNDQNLNILINREDGHRVGALGFSSIVPITINDGTEIIFRLAVDVDLSSIFPPNTIINTKNSFDLRIAKNRIQVQLRFEKVVSKLTNYISP